MLALLACLLGASAARPQNAPAPALVIRDVTVISPERAAPLEHAYVRIRNGRIDEVSAKPLDEKRQIDGRGRFLIPGLIDSHMHLGAVPGMSPAQRTTHPDLAGLADAQEARSYFYFGFTTVLSLGATAEPIKRWNALDIRPDAYFCGGTPIVHGYSIGSVDADPYFLFNPDQAGSLPPSIDPSQQAREPVVNRMARDGAICVKSYYESGFGAMAGKLPVPSLQMIQAVVAAAPARNLPVFLHANSRQAQEFAAKAGVDVVAHGMWNGHDSTKGKLAGLYEMRAWIAAGVTARQLLRAATIENARIMGLDRDVGTVEKGKRAHLLLLRANPLDGVEAYNTIEDG